MALRRQITAHPHLTYNALVLPISYVALSSTPSLPSTSVLLSILILQTTMIFNRSPKQAIPLILNLALGSTLSTISASTTALSSPTTSLIFSFARGALFASLALIVLGMRYTLTRAVPSSRSWLKVAAFPALWALSWMVITKTSPLGRLGSWTPLVGDEAYRWMRPFVGLAGVDFVTAGWAEVGAAVAGMWIQGSAEDQDEEEVGRPSERQALIGEQGEGRYYGSTRPSQPTYNHKPRPTKSNSTILTLMVLLFLFSLPSYHTSPLPLPTYTDSTTPLSVACVLPPHRSPNSPKTPLDLYIMETRAVAPRAKIVLWPEGAVSFRTTEERKHAVELVKNTTVVNKVWIGMSFEEPAGEGGHRGKLVRNGMALISPDPKVKQPIIFEYFKRNLVPIAESFSQLASSNEPPTSTISLPAPPSLPKPETHTWPRDITLSTSICLDFTQPFPRLPTHPDLILAPARTWHPSVGLAMASLAAARGDELGASVLWCDGGAGAVGGVYGFGRGAGGLLVEEVGNGGRSWVATFGVPYE
ncbi:hypothetical protein FRB90_009194, partial [Tulasnella sp. 427]